MTSRQAPDHAARVVPLRPAAGAPDPKEPLWRDLVGEVLRRERLAQGRTLKEVAETARISMPYLSEIERGRKEASSEVLAAAARALGLGLADLLALTHRELTVRTVSTLPLSSLRPSGQGQGQVRLAA
ncbi:helix-turn-helix domain-containing protein [Streptomyces inusitatus]|uniref:helix-turn-helix domain-containing protein n=1 Tax=Streptomyces inusitatus TaxID=68221 RepID=UPI00167ECEDA|nr:helix-turn-helix transcriptional regulator [Streptomyces inusitatus]